MGIIKGIFKVEASAILTVTGTASTILKGMSDSHGNRFYAQVLGILARLESVKWVQVGFGKYRQ